MAVNGSKQSPGRCCAPAHDGAGKAKPGRGETALVEATGSKALTPTLDGSLDPLPLGCGVTLQLGFWTGFW